MRRIAVVEDDRSLNDHFAGILRGIDDVEVLQAYSAVEGQAIVQRDLDLVVLDIDLGGSPKNRYAGLQILAGMSGRRCAAIVVSGMPESNLGPLSLSFQAYDFLEKPVDPLVFATKVEQALDWDSTASEVAAMVPRWPPHVSVDSERPPNLRWKGKRLNLTITELSVVYCLVGSAGKVVEYRKLARAMKTAESQQVLATHIRGVRKRFLEADPTFDRIDVAPAKGYVWKLTT